MAEFSTFADGGMSYASGQVLCDAYRAVRVPLLGGGDATIDVRKYYINNAGTSDAKLAGRYTTHNEGIEAFRVAVRALQRVEGTYCGPQGGEIAVGGYEYAAFFYGKASPSEIARTLQLAQIAGLVESTETAIQDYCDTYGGVDCSGFVSTFRGESAKVKVDNRESLYYLGGAKRIRIEDFRHFDVIVWKSKHVALIDSLGSMGHGASSDGYVYRTAHVCESTPTALERDEGVQRSVYEFRARIEHVDFLRPTAVGHSAFLRSGLPAFGQRAEDTRLRTSPEWEMKRGGEWHTHTNRITVHECL